MKRHGLTYGEREVPIPKVGQGSGPCWRPQGGYQGGSGALRLLSGCRSSVWFKMIACQLLNA